MHARWCSAIGDRGMGRFRRRKWREIERTAAHLASARAPERRPGVANFRRDAAPRRTTLAARPNRRPSRRIGRHPHGLEASPAIPVRFPRRNHHSRALPLARRPAVSSAHVRRTQAGDPKHPPQQGPAAAFPLTFFFFARQKKIFRFFFFHAMATWMRKMARLPK